jgi:hypothetical protein
VPIGRVGNSLAMDRHFAVIRKQGRAFWCRKKSLANRPARTIWNLASYLFGACYAKEDHVDAVKEVKRSALHPKSNLTVRLDLRRALGTKFTYALDIGRSFQHRRLDRRYSPSGSAGCEIN